MHELYLERDSLIHRTDTRVKLILTLVFIVSISLTPPGAWPAYILFFSLILAITQVSKVEWKILFNRSLVAIPFGLAALPLLFSASDTSASFCLFQQHLFYYDPMGVIKFFSIMIKIWLSMQAAILLNATTTFTDLLDGLHLSGLPDVFVAIFALMWRYLFVIVQEAERLMHARASRSSRLPGLPRGSNTFVWRAKVTGRMAGSLFLRSLERSDRVYAAMQSRGYNGQQPSRPGQRLNQKEIMVLGLSITGLLVILFIGILTGKV